MPGVKFKFVEGTHPDYVKRIIWFSKYTKNHGDERDGGIFRERWQIKS